MPVSEHFRLRRDGNRRIDNLRLRARALRRLRAFFDAEDFLEIEAPLLVPSPGLELHLDAFAVPGAGYLITSPEYQLKRLLAAGLPRIYSLARCFRRGEAGPRHNPEFTMVEWYRAPGTWQEVAADVERLTAALAHEVAGGAVVVRDGRSIDLSPPWERLSVREAMQRHAGIDLRGDESLEELTAKVEGSGRRVPVLGPGQGQEMAAWDDVFFSVFLDAVEPNLGQSRPTLLYDWPAPLCALARRKPGDPAVVERFEAYAGGLELCNGFGELIDAVEQRARLFADREERARRGLPQYPVDERFLDALAEGIPAAGGVALGFDRVCMLLLGAATLRDVTAFTVDEL